MYNFKVWNPVPKMVLVLPEMSDQNDAGSGFVIQREKTDQAVGTIKKVGRAPQYAIGNTDDIAYCPGMIVTYRKASSQSIKFLDEEGETLEYRIVHQDDITGVIVNDQADDQAGA